MRFRQYYVYIMASHSRVLYIGVTNDVARRVTEHRSCVDPDAFCSRYRVFQLVYFEEYQTARQAIAREKQLKVWLRSKKLALVDAFNPEWRDLAPAPAQILRRLRDSG